MTLSSVGRSRGRQDRTTCAGMPNRRDELQPLGVRKSKGMYGLVSTRLSQRHKLALSELQPLARQEMWAPMYADAYLVLLPAGAGLFR